MDASSLYEAVVLALVEFKRSQLTPATVPVGASISVRVKEPEITHEAKFKGIEEWLFAAGKDPEGTSGQSESECVA